jgi:hypothetical protein
MSVVIATAEQKKAALHAAVQARLAFLAAMDAVESLFEDSGNIEDKQGDALHDLVVSLAEGYPGQLGKPNPNAIQDRHVDDLNKIFA